MGQRLNIEMISNGIPQANTYYHWSGYTSSAMELTQIIVKNESIINEKVPVLRAIRLLETTGALLTEDELKAAKEFTPTEAFKVATNRNEGFIGITEKGMEATRDWEEARVEIDLDSKTVNFLVLWSDNKEGFLDAFEEEEEAYEGFPIRSYSFEHIPFHAFDALAEDVQSLINEGTYHIRLSGEDGDVVSFIE